MMDLDPNCFDPDWIVDDILWLALIDDLPAPEELLDDCEEHVEAGWDAVQVKPAHGWIRRLGQRLQRACPDAPAVHVDTLADGPVRPGHPRSLRTLLQYCVMDSWHPDVRVRDRAWVDDGAMGEEVFAILDRALLYGYRVPA